MQLSPQLQSAILALIVAILAPGAVVSTDRFVHSLGQPTSSNVQPAPVDSTSQLATEQYMEGVVDRIIDKVLGSSKGS